jgi:hypothetical protein
MAFSRSVQCGNLHTNCGWSKSPRVAIPVVMIKKRYKVPSRTERYECRTRDAGYRRQKLDAIAQLEIAAKIRNTRVFDKVFDSIDWGKRTPSEFVRVIDLALRIGAYTTARRVSQMGLARYPRDERIQKYHTILAEPSVTQRAVPFDPSIRANRDWLKVHRDKYRGKWIGLQNGNLLRSADSIDELMHGMDSSRDVLITRVY